MSVCNLSADFTIARIVEALLPRGGSRGPLTRMEGRPSLALYLSVDMRLSVYHENGKEDHENRMVHFVFERPSNATRVWAAVNDSWAIPDPSKLIQQSFHDSCWRTAGLQKLSESYLDALHLLRERNPSARITDFTVIRDMSWTEIKHEKDPVGLFNHIKVLTSIERTARIGK